MGRTGNGKETTKQRPAVPSVLLFFFRTARMISSLVAVFCFCFFLFSREVSIRGSGFQHWHCFAIVPPPAISRSTLLRGSNAVQVLRGTFRDYVWTELLLFTVHTMRTRAPGVRDSRKLRAD